MMTLCHHTGAPLLLATSAFAKTRRIDCRNEDEHFGQDR